MYMNAYCESKTCSTKALIANETKVNMKKMYM